jgi:hypothetical protein
MTTRTRKAALVSIFALLASVAAVNTAHADPIPGQSVICSSGFEWIDFSQPGSTHELHIGCKPATGPIIALHSFTNSSSADGCVNSKNKVGDTIKGWLTMVTSWALAGKKVRYYYTASCGGFNVIDTVSLQRQ